jgi:hypothetical protein
MHVQLVDAVFEPVLDADGLMWQLAGLARRDEADPELAGQRAAEDEATCLGRDDQVDAERPRMVGQPG